MGQNYPALDALRQPHITTYTNRTVNPLDLQPDDVDIQDVAHALSCVNRFAGHTAWPISVAQHSVGVSLLCGDAFGLAGLLHDASEAYLGDMTKWMKQDPAMESYRLAEEQAQQAVWDHFGIRYKERDHGSIIQWADKLMVRYEYELGYSRSIDEPGGYTALTKGERTTFSHRLNPTLWQPCQTWIMAKACFQARFKELT